MFYNNFGDIMDRQILHVDVNNAFLSWTAVDMLKNGERLDIRTIPAVIGGDEKLRHGIVLAKSVLAQNAGIVTGEPLYQARKKCSVLRVFSANFKVYKEYSDCLYDLLCEYTNRIERFSIDECFLDVTEFLGKRNLIEVANEIGERVKEELGFTVNVGVAHNKLLAKMASDFSKPDKVHTLFREEIPDKMWPLPVGELFMLGKKTVPKLRLLGIRTIGDLAKYDYQLICYKFGKFGKMIWEYANGIDNSDVISEELSPKGIGNSVTLPEDRSGIEELNSVLSALSEQVSFRLRKKGLFAETISVQLRTSDFKDFSHQRKLAHATCSTIEIYQEAKEILSEMYRNQKIRLVGLRVDHLTDKPIQQVSLFDTDVKNEKQEKIDKAVDELKQKFGYESVMRASGMQTSRILKRKDE